MGGFPKKNRKVVQPGAEMATCGVDSHVPITRGNIQPLATYPEHRLVLRRAGDEACRLRQLAGAKAKKAPAPLPLADKLPLPLAGWSSPFLRCSIAGRGGGAKERAEEAEDGKGTSPAGR